MKTGHFSFEAPNTRSTHDGAPFTFWVEPRMVLQDEAFGHIYAVHRCSSVQKEQGKSEEIYSGRKRPDTHIKRVPYLFFGCSFDDCTYGCGVQKISQPLTGRLKKGKSGRTSCRLQSILNNSPKSCFFGYITEHRVKLDLVFAT